MAFHRINVNDTSFLRGAARLLIAPLTQAFPTQINDVIHLASTGLPSGVSQYDAQTGWTDLGATKTGCAISINNAEDTFDVDQVSGDLSSQPSAWECTIATSLAEATPEHLQVAWEGSAITIDNTPTTGAEKQIGFGQPTSYTQRRLAVLFQRPSGLIRGYFFRIVNRTPQQSTITHAKTGEQIVIPITLKAFADTTITDVYSRFFIIRDQATT